MASYIMEFALNGNNFTTEKFYKFQTARLNFQIQIVNTQMLQTLVRTAFISYTD